MAIAHDSQGATYTTGGFKATSHNSTASAWPTASDTVAVLTLSTCAPNDATLTVTLAGQSPDTTVDSDPYGNSGGTQWYPARQVVMVWKKATLDAGSGTTLSVGTSSSTNVHYSLDYFTGVDQTTPVRNSGTDYSGDYDPTATTVAGDVVVVAVSDRQDNDGGTYDGGGTELENVASYTDNDDASFIASATTASGSSTTCNHTLSSSSGGHAYVTLAPASSSAITVGTADVTVTTYALTVTTSAAITIGTADVVVTTYALTVNTATDGAVIDGLTVQVREGGHRGARTPRAPEVRRNARGKALSGITSTRGRKRRWDLTTIPMGLGDAEALEAKLTTGVAITCSGWLFGGSITARAFRVRLEPDQNFRFTVSFELRES